MYTIYNKKSEQPVETRPAQLERWLESLPYDDALFAADQLQNALKETNKQVIKPATRFELLGRYARGERRLIDTHVIGHTPSGPRSLEQNRRLTDALRRVATEIAFGAKLVVHDTLSRGFGFGERSPPTEALLMCMRYLGHVAVLNYHEYAPTPKLLWREIHETLLQAEELGVACERVREAEAPGMGDASVLDAYHQLAATAIADPHRLPYGTAWRIYDQLRSWAGDIVMTPYAPAPNPNGFFVVDLRRPEPPVSYTKFRAEIVSDQHRLIDCNPLQRHLQAELQERQASAAQAYVAEPADMQRQTLLFHLLKSWSLPARRYFPRNDRSGLLNVACGLPAAWTMLRDALPLLARPPEPPAAAATSGTSLEPEQWNFVNEGPGGYAICNTVRPRSLVQIGELIAIEGLERPYSSLQALGVVRWLMVQRNSTQLTGVQIIARTAVPITLQGPAVSTGAAAAFLVPPATQGAPGSLVTPRGVYAPERTFLVLRGAERQSVTALQLLETTAGFDHFTFLPAR